MLKKIIIFVMILSMLAGVCSCTKAPRPQSQITDVVQTKDYTYECQFEGMTFKFMLFLPEKVDGGVEHPAQHARGVDEIGFIIGADHRARSFPA